MVVVLMAASKPFVEHERRKPQTVHDVAGECNVFFSYFYSGMRYGRAAVFLEACLRTSEDQQACR